jgi:hypothetical protein
MRTLWLLVLIPALAAASEPIGVSGLEDRIATITVRSRELPELPPPQPVARVGFHSAFVNTTQFGLEGAALARQPIDIGDFHDRTPQERPMRILHHIDRGTLHLVKMGDNAVAHPLVGRPEVSQRRVVAADPGAVGTVEGPEHGQCVIDGVFRTPCDRGHRQRSPQSVLPCGDMLRTGARILGQSLQRFLLKTEPASRLSCVRILEFVERYCRSSIFPFFQFRNLYNLAPSCPRATILASSHLATLRR